MKLLKKLNLSVKPRINIRKHFSFSKLFFYWIIPLSFALIAGLFLVIFNYTSTPHVGGSTEPTPARIITITEDFSAKFYFNNTFGETIFSDALIKAINESKEHIELAVYSMDHTAIRDALYRAAQRGVAVTLILSDKKIAQHNKLFKDLPKNIRRIDIVSSNIGSSGNLMHHKFIVIDRDTKNQKLFFGSYNFTELQEKYDPSFLMETSRPEIIEVFAQELARLENDIHGQGKLKKGYNPFAALIKYPQGYLEIWFAPQTHRGGLRDRLLALIRNAKTSVNVLIWDMTDKEIAQSLASAAMTKPVQVLVDDANFATQGSVAPLLVSQKKLRNLDKLSILTDVRRNEELLRDFDMKDFNSFLHYHLLLVDDTTALFGTNNWSNGGFYNNDESIMVTNIPSVVKSFKDTFNVNYDKAK